MNLKDALKRKLSKKELAMLPRAFDVVGDVAMIEIPPGLAKKKAAIAKAMQQVHPNIRTVCSKLGDRSGRYRLRKLEVVLGKGTETEHRESGCRFRLDVRQAYFSGREGTERQRVASQVKPGEKVLVMFSGVGPYAIVIAKRQPKVGKVYAVEVNPKAHAYASENVRINRVQLKVEPVCGDVRKACPALRQRFDRILMPLPKGAHRYLDVAFRCLKSRGVIHFYHWDREEDLYSKALRIIQREARKAKRTVRIANMQRVLPYGPGQWKICIDLQVSE
ncbi:MAG: class I SAM-dependent methyltransferase family protein [Candidatus Aenigmarchaeota archaeon]|nr:class I SAM-dependent methyltransferase family protein [Candidatus Aenigmarchaeota archaeon]